MEWSNEQIKKQIEEIAFHTKVMNEELGGVQKEMNEIKDILSKHREISSVNKTNIEWLKDAFKTLDNRTWIILSVIILGFIIQIGIKFLF